MFQPNALPVVPIALAFFAGGTVKGVIGIGLPLVVVPVIATFSTPLHAIALMLVPAVTSNVMQAGHAGFNRRAFARFWPAIAGIGAGAVLGSTVLRGADPSTSGAVLGVVVVLFCASQLLTGLPPIGRRAERWFTPLAGGASGLAGGLTGFFGVALVPYLLALRLEKEEFVATIAMLYVFGVGALYGNLFLEGVFSWSLVAVSALVTIPTLAGVWMGSRLRRRVPEQVFRRILVLVLFLIALNLLRRSWWG